MPSQFDGLTRRSREIGGGQRTYTVHTQGGLAPGGAPKAQQFSTRFGVGRQTTLSEGHMWPPRSRELQDVGGPFRTTRMYVTDRVGGKPLTWDQFPIKTVYSALFGQGPGPGSSMYPIGYSYTAPFIPVSPGTTMEGYWGSVPNPSSSESSLISLGARAIARCKPTNPAADLSVGLAEIFREGLPHRPGVTTWENRSNIARGAGSEYLNTVFGWQPLVSEIRAVASAAKRQDEIWRQFQRDAGRVVRRGYKFPVDKTTTHRYTYVGQSPDPAPNIYVLKRTGTRSCVRHVERRVWFSGAFTYYLPSKRLGERGGQLNRWLTSIDKLRSVYGLTLDPEVVWNLMPWSWAADWFANTGDVISNVSDLMTDGLVMRYGYIMEHVVETDEVSLTGCVPVKGDDISDLKICFVRETKQRLRASPYGFGLTWDDFSPRQLAILAALGLSRS